MKWKDKIITIILVVLLVAFIIILVGGLFFLGFAGLFYLIGIEYDSITSLIIFVAVFFVIGLIVDVFFEAFAKIANSMIEEKMVQAIIRLSFGVLGNGLVLMIVDFFIAGITLSSKAIIILAICLSLIDELFTDKKEQTK